MVLFPALFVAVVAVLTVFHSQYTQTGNRLDRLESRLYKVMDRIIDTNVKWRKEQISSGALLGEAAAFHSQLDKMSTELSRPCAYRSQDRRRGQIIQQLFLTENHLLSAEHCANAVLYSPHGKNDNLCFPFNLQGTFADIQKQNKALGEFKDEGGFTSALIGRVRGWFGHGPRGPDKPNVIIIVLDAARADAVYKKGAAPFLQQLAAEGLVFDDALSMSSNTHTSVATLLTGTPPRTHGLIDYEAWNHEMMISEVFKKAGYQTAGFSANSVISDSLDFNYGFDTFVQRYWVPAEMLNLDVSAYLAGVRDASKPQFLYLHYIDPHDPYFSPDYFNRKTKNKFDWPGSVDPNIVRDTFNKNGRDGRERVDKKQLAEMKAMYAREVSYIDRRLRALFDVLRAAGVLDNALVIITADHGEEFLEHGGVKHTYTLYQEVIHVPLIVWGNLPQGWRKQHRADRPVSLMDVAPTVLDFAGLKRTPHCRGAHLFGDTVPEERYGFTQGMAPGKFTDACRIGYLVAGPWKFITCDKKNVSRLYNLEDDPGEIKDLLNKNPEVAKKLSGKFAKWFKATKGPRPKKQKEIDQDTIEQLKSLGYIE